MCQSCHENCSSCDGPEETDCKTCVDSNRMTNNSSGPCVCKNLTVESNNNCVDQCPDGTVENDEKICVVEENASGAIKFSFGDCSCAYSNQNVALVGKSVSAATALKFPLPVYERGAYFDGYTFYEIQELQLNESFGFYIWFHTWDFGNSALFGSTHKTSINTSRTAQHDVSSFALSLYYNSRY